MQRSLFVVITLCYLLPCLLSAQEPYIVKDSVANEDPIFNTFNVEVKVASKTASSLDDTPGIVTVIDRSQIDFTNARTLSDIVRMIPGFDFSRVTIGFGEPIEGFYPRGIPSDLSQPILFLLNGRNKFNDFSFSGPWIAHKINVDMIERIEVIRGPGSALYGGNAFTAVINIVTRDQDTRPESLFEVTYGTFNYVSLYGLTRQNIGGWILGIQAKYFQDEGTSYESLSVDRSYGGNPLREPYLITDGMNPSYDVSINLQDAKNKFNIQAWHTFHDPHPMLAGYYPTPNNGNYQYRVQQTMFNLSYTPIENLNIAADVTFMKWNWRTLVYDNPNYRNQQVTYLENDLLGAEQNNRQVQADINYTFFLGGKSAKEGEKKLQHEILVGGSFSIDGQHDSKSLYYDSTLLREVETTQPDDTLAFYPDFTRVQGSFYTQDTWQVSQRLALTMGVRLDYYDDIGFNYNPRLAAVLDLDRERVNKLKVLYGEGFRPPGGFELKGIKLGPLKGTANLNPEKIRTAEVAYITYLRRDTSSTTDIKKKNVLRLQISAYYSDVQDAIFSVTNTDPDSVSIPLKYANVGERQVFGIEAELKAKYWWANYSYVNSQSINPNDGSQSRTPFIANHQFNAGFQLPLFGEPFFQSENTGVKGLYFSSQFFYRSGRLNGVHEAKRETTAYYELDAKLLYQVANLEFNFGVTNLLDRSWSFPLNDEGTYELPYRGRQILLKAVIHIQ